MDLEILQDQLKVELLKWSQELQDLYQRKPQDQIYAAIGIVVLTVFFLAILRLFKCKGHKASKTVVLVGLCGSGKTFLFHQLRDGSTPPGTEASLEPNADTFVLFSERSKIWGRIKPVHVVDVPGHRLRSKLNEFFLPEASAVVFVVDASEILSNWLAASEYLYELLTMESVVEKKIPVLILCNKVDKFKSLTKGFIEGHLERGIEMVISADVKREFLYGAARNFFRFSQCHSSVTIGESSGLAGEIYELEDFIREHVKP